MKAFQQILNQPNHYLIQFDLAWQNLQAVEYEFKQAKKQKPDKICFSDLKEIKKQMRQPFGYLSSYLLENEEGNLHK